MIVQFIITGLLGLLGFLIGLLPNGDAWNPDLGIVGGVFGSAKALDAYLPITEIFICVGIALSILAARWTFTVVVWVYNKVRGS